MKPTPARPLRYLLSLLPIVALGAGSALGVFGCGGDDAAGGSAVQVTRVEDGGESSYGEDQDVVVAGDDTYVVSGDPGDECVELDNGECVPLGEAKGRYCDEEGAQADVIVIDGEVADVICYPPDDDGTPIEEVAVDGEGNAEVPQNQSGTVVVFNEETNGEPLEGDVTLVAERTAIYGNGVDETIIDGNLTISSNNSRVRGLTITGDLTIDKVSNNAAAAFCKVHGKLMVEGNGVTVANCQVFGDVEVTGNDATLVNIGVGGAWDVNDKSTCDGCYTIDDENDDFEVDEEEVGGDLTCGEEPANNGG